MTTCTIHAHQPSATQHGTTRTYRGSYMVAEWKFDDGVTIDACERHDEISYQGNRRYRTTNVELTKKVRIYVSADEPFNVLEDLTNRTRRPHNAWKPRVIEALSRIGIEFDYLGWDQYAGCASCPCSPGFVPRDKDALRGWDFWVTLPGAPTVDERKPAREL